MKICIDPGHGGHDPGAVNPRLRELPPEKAVALQVGKLLATELATAGHTCSLTRTTDRYIEISERCNFSNRFGADLFISIHCNSAESSQANGIEVLHAAGSSRGIKLAGKVLGKLTSAFPGLRNRGLLASPSAKYPRNIGVLRGTNAPAILVELGFISNSVEGPMLADAANQAKYAKAIAAGVAEYLK